MIRYRHEERGLIAPDFFIPPLEKEHLIRYIDLFVLEQACRLLGRWQQEGHKTFPISINFSRITLMEEEILPSLLELVHTYQISPSLIQIEITETIEEKDCDVLLTLSHQLRQAGLDKFVYFVPDSQLPSMISAQNIQTCPFSPTWILTF